MTQDEKDAVCELWVAVFGTQEGTGYNCPAGAYTFAEVVAAEERRKMIELVVTALGGSK